MPWVDFPEVRDYLTLDNLIRLAEHPHLANSEIQRLSGLSCGEFSATSKASSEKEKQTFLRSKNVYGEFSATSKASSEKEKQTFLRSKNVYGELDTMSVVNGIERETKVYA